MSEPRIVRKVGRDTADSPLYMGFRVAYCTWCGADFILCQDVQICPTCDRTVAAR